MRFFFITFAVVHQITCTSVRECTIDYLVEKTCIHICALLCFYHIKFYMFIIMSISVKRHELWFTVRDVCLSKCSIIIIIIIILHILSVS